MRLTDFRYEVQREKALEAIENHKCEFTTNKNAKTIFKIPGCPLAFWISEQYFRVLSGTIASDYARFCKGMDTGDNNRFYVYGMRLDLIKCILKNGFHITKVVHLDVGMAIMNITSWMMDMK